MCSLNLYLPVYVSESILKIFIAYFAVNSICIKIKALENFACVKTQPYQSSGNELERIDAGYFPSVLRFFQKKCSHVKIEINN